MKSPYQINHDRRRALKQLLITGLAPTFLYSAPAIGQNVPPSFQGKRRPYTQVKPAFLAPLKPMYAANGNITNLRRYRKKVVLLNLWATWCASCLHELPALSRLQRYMGGVDFDVVTLNIDEANPDRIASYFKRLSIKNLPRFQDPSARFPTALETHHGMPWSFVIDRDGFVQGYVIGSADWDSGAARQLLSFYLK